VTVAAWALIVAVVAALISIFSAGYTARAANAQKTAATIEQDRREDELRRHAEQLAARERNNFTVSRETTKSTLDAHPLHGGRPRPGTWRLYARVEVAGTPCTYSAVVSNLTGVIDPGDGYAARYSPSLTWREAETKGAKTSHITDTDFVMVGCLFSDPRVFAFFHASNFDSPTGGPVEPFTPEGDAFGFDLRVVNHDTEKSRRYRCSVVFREDGTIPDFTMTELTE
jgi:hypothetical protein